MKEDEIDRLDSLEKKFDRNIRRGNRLCWIKYNPGAEYGYDVVDADEDIRWMVFEIKRLRDENRHYKEFIGSLKDQMLLELKMPPEKVPEE